MLDNKQTLYLRREAIASEVFAAVRDRIAAYSATPDYRKRLTEVARQAVDTLKGADDIVIHLRAEDMDQSAAITAALGGVKVTFEADPTILLGGLTAVSASLGLPCGCHLRHRHGRAERTLRRALRPVPVRRSDRGVRPRPRSLITCLL